MHALIRGVVAGAIVLVLGGCSIHVTGKDGADGRDGGLVEFERDNRLAIESLRLGMGLPEVQSVMPHESDFSEAFTVGGASYRVLFYRTQRVARDGVTTRDETTPLVFRNGELMGWGESAWFELTGRPLVRQ
ncbi:MAG TPA: DUF3192 domain-containing protein [Wenzhouxiangellaceae bacterium]|nr:DUF3192 domain-containing protein [Wenzhouxiangellaceae bacterium]